VPRDCNETVIRLDHDLKIAEIWTPNRRVQSTLRRAGAEPLERQIGGQWWRVPFRVGTRGINLGKKRPKACFGRRKAIPAGPAAA
jgi:hypothetical protein